MFPPADAQRVMSQVTIYFGVAPAVAPMVGGFLFIHAGWHSIFWLLTAVGIVLFAANWRLLPETLHDSTGSRSTPGNLLRGYWSLASDPRFLMLALASGIPFNGVFLYVLSTPVFLGQTPRPRAGRVLLVLRPHDRRHRLRRVGLRAHGRPRQGDLADPLRLSHHGRHRRDQPRAEPAVRARGLVGAAADRASTRSAGR